jgi:hypothetical protein
MKGRVEGGARARARVSYVRLGEEWGVSMEPRCDILMLYASSPVYCLMAGGCMVWYRLQYLVLTLLCLVSCLCTEQ